MRGLPQPKCFLLFQKRRKVNKTCHLVMLSRRRIVCKFEKKELVLDDLDGVFLHLLVEPLQSVCVCVCQTPFQRVSHSRFQ